ncbi:MAG: Peptidase rhomboid domain [Sphingobacteriales bacterium]|nr:Peptidase rhomboid domain [Sphingobacteriales bacterium]
MNKSVFHELYYKAFKSGNRLFLFIGINTIVFIALAVLSVGEWLFFRSSPIANWIERQLSAPAYLPSLPYRFWSVVTYMFSHRNFFHFFFNMLGLYWLGTIFLDFLNKRQFTFTYLAGGISGAAFYIIFYNVFPAFRAELPVSNLIGASASVMAIVVAAATLVPDFTIRLLLIGSVRLKYVALFYVLISFLFIISDNSGGYIAHLGGAFLGYIYIKALQNGNDWSKMFHKRSKLKVVKSNRNTTASNKLPDQEVIDKILDKISVSGYDSLSRSEKEQLFNASKEE